MSAAATAAAADPLVDLTPRPLWRRARWPVAAGLLVVVVFTVVALATASEHGALDPDSADPAGARAIATLLRERGVQVRQVDSPAAAGRGADRRTTVLVPFPARLSSRQLAALTDLPAGVDLVVIDPPERALRPLAPAVRRRGQSVVAERAPHCALPAARTAGVALTGGTTYDVVSGPAVRCYPSRGDATLVRLPRSGGGTLTLLGTGAPFANDELGHEGNAALALALLGAANGPGTQLRWLLPPADAVAASAGEQKPLLDLVPGNVLLAVLQLAVAVVLLALWRARRLGPVVDEPLPVVVRAAETVEGRARLYRAARARDRAAAALRAGARHHVVPTLGLPATASPRAVVDAVATRAGAPAARVDALLYGAAPDGDAELTELARELDRLEDAVQHRRVGR